MWRQVTIGEEFHTVTGSTPPKNNPDNYGDYISLVKPPELLNAEIGDTSDNLSKTGALNARLLEKGAVLVSCIGNLGKVGIATRQLSCNQQINAIIPNEKTDSRFLFYLALSPWFQRQLHTLASGTTVQIVNKSRFNSIKACIPPLDEQKRIVAILDQAFEGIDKAIDNTEQNLKNALELFDGHLRKTFSALEADWPQEKFEEIVQNSLVGLVKNSKEQGPDLDYPYVKMNNITADGRFDSAKLTYVNASMEDTRRYALQDGDFLFNTRNSAELVGKNCIFKPSTSKPMLFNNNIMRIRFKPKADAIFVAYAFRAPNVKSQLEAFVSGTTNVAAIYQKQLRTLKLVLPSLPVQKSTSQALHKASGHVKSLTAGYDRKIELLSELKQSLLQKAFSGELTNTDRQEAAKVA